MLVRTATGADAAAIARLNALVQELHHRELPQLFKAPDPEAFLPMVGAWLEKGERTGFIATVESGDDVGYVLLAVRQRPETSLTRPATVAELDQIAVDPRHRRQGVGSALVQEVVNHARDLGVDAVELTVHSFNEGAVAFFSAMGLTVATNRMRLPLRQ